VAARLTPLACKAARRRREGGAEAAKLRGLKAESGGVGENVAKSICRRRVSNQLIFGGVK